MRSGVLKRVDKVKRGRGRTKLTWDESVKRDLKDWNISKEVALDRSAWRLLPACLNRDICVFWVSSLACPNSLGTKDYVVVVECRSFYFTTIQLPRCGSKKPMNKITTFRVRGVEAAFFL